MSRISIIVPVYQVEPYLDRCVESILCQTFEDFDLILVDDGSPDRCGAICDAYAAADQRVHVIHQQNGGLSVARNAGIDWSFGNSNSEFLTFIDSDDYVKPTMLETLFLALMENNADVSVCGEYHFSESPEKAFRENFVGCVVHSSAAACRLIYTGEAGHASFVSAWGKLYRKELFSQVRYPAGKIHEDQFTTYQVMYAARSVVEAGACLYGYFFNETGITHSRFSIRRYDDVDACNQAINFFQDRHEDRIAEAAQLRRRTLIAKYAIYARKAGIYRQIPVHYRMSVPRVYVELKQILGLDHCEYFLNQHYPHYIRLCAVIRKICGIIRHNHYGGKDA